MSDKESGNEDAEDSKGGVIMFGDLFGREVTPTTATADVEYSDESEEES